MRDLAEQFVDEGLSGDVLTYLICYLDYDVIDCNLSADYMETEVAEHQLVYQWG